MYVSMRDGHAVFGKWLLRGAATPGSFDVRPEGTVCYSDEEREVAERILQERGIPYTVEPITVDDSLKTKTQGIRYGSRSEVLAHLESGIEPEGMRVATLTARCSLLENELQTVKSELAAVKQKISLTPIL
jgi:hypothetical protein